MKFTKIILLLLVFTFSGNTIASEQNMSAIPASQACVKGASHGAIAAMVGIFFDCVFLGCAITAATAATMSAPVLVAGTAVVAVTATTGCIADVATN